MKAVRKQRTFAKLGTQRGEAEMEEVGEERPVKQRRRRRPAKSTGLRERQSTGSEKMAAAYSDDSDGEDESSPVDSALARLTSSQQLDENDREELDVIAKLRKELADRPFAEVQKLKDTIGTKAYNVMFGGSKPKHHSKKVFKRENKNRPMEVSSKTKFSQGHQVAQANKKMGRDPRFDDLSGEYNETFFNTAYSFLDDVKQVEKEKVLKEMRKTKNDEKKSELKHLLRRMNDKERKKLKQDNQHRLSSEQKKQEMSSVQQGKRPFYLKQSEKKKLELADKYRELKKSGKVETYLSRKRKKTASKDRKKLPPTGL